MGLDSPIWRWVACGLIAAAAPACKGGGSAHVDAAVDAPPRPDAHRAPPDGAQPDAVAVDATIAADTAAAPEAGPDTAPPMAPRSAPWRASDVGDVGATKGTMTLSTPANDTQVLRMKAGGTDIGGKADSFSFFYQPVAGNAEILANVKSLTRVDDGTRAGIMIRESLEPGAPSVFVGPAGDGSVGGVIVGRAARGGDSFALPAPTDNPALDARIKTATWLRLVREGATVRVFVSGRTAWIEVGAVKLALASPDAELLFGFAAAAHGATASTTAELNNLHVNNLAADVSSRALYQQDFGTLGSTALWDAGKLVLTGWGQPWDTVMDTYREFFSYVFRPSLEDESLSVKVESLRSNLDGDPGVRAGVMFRISNGAPPALSFDFSRSGAGAALSVTASGLQLQARVISATNDPKKELAVMKTEAGIKPPLWLRLDKRLATTAVMQPSGFLTIQANTTVSASYALRDAAGMPGPWVALGDPVAFPFGVDLLGCLGVHVSSGNGDAFAAATVSQITFGPAQRPKGAP